MLANIEKAAEIFGANFSDIVVCAVIMVSAIIVAIGFFKLILINKITNKHLRKAVLALSSVAACFGTVFVYFLVKGWTFENYLAASIALSVFCVITYWLYEFTCLRNLIALIGGMALRKLVTLAGFAITTDDVKAVKQELKKTGEELKAHTKQELKKATAKIKEDKDLRGL